MSVTTFKKTTIHLGKSSQAHIVKNKAKYKDPQSGFCPYCYATVELTPENDCKICGARVVRKATYASFKKRFEMFLEKNQDILDCWIADRPENEQLKVPIVLGGTTYYVALRYFKEYEGLFGTNEKNAYQLFFDYIRMVCPSMKC